MLSVVALASACSDDATTYGSLAEGGQEQLSTEVGRAGDPASTSTATGSSAADLQDPIAARGADRQDVAPSEPDSSSPAAGGPPSTAGGSQSSGGGSAVSPPLRQPVSLPDEALAREALRLMGSAAVGAEGSCRDCHSLGRPTLTRWQELTDAFDAACLGSSQLDDTAAADALVACFHGQAQPEPSWSSSDFGIYAAAAHLPWFTTLFARATEFSADPAAGHAEFVSRVGMPRSGTSWTQEQFDIVAEWFARGLPLSFELVPEDNGQDCTPGLDPRLRAHVAEMQQSGWRARNQQVPLLMFGCTGNQTGAECLSTLPLASAAPYAMSWDAPGAARIRVLHDNSGATSNYWSRSSADGRFIASGLRALDAGGYAGQIVDLLQGRTFSGDFGYDPTFFPDNTGFMVQRSAYAKSTGPTSGAANPLDVAVVCNQSALVSAGAAFTGDEPECVQLTGQVGLYQQLARSLDGDDYWVTYGSFDEDNGGFSPSLEHPSAAFDSQSTITLTPMLNDGAGFVPGQSTRLLTPAQGDPMLSPSGRLLITRVKGREYTVTSGERTIVKAEQSGYALHLVSSTNTASGVAPELADVGRICLQGGKAVVSYDERWLVLHRYVTAASATELGFSGPVDPAFADYLRLGASNLVLVDLLTGSTHVLTQMAAGQYALYPHFRSDGWIYFVVRTIAGQEYFAATDAALLLESTSN